jgi:hypothetical protein
MPGPTFSQGTKSSPGSGTSASLAYTGAVTAGDTLVCALRIGSAAVTGVTVSDTINGSWTVSTQVETTGGDFLVVAYFQNATSGTPTVNASWTTSASIRFIIAEYTGVATASVDQIALNQTSGVTNTPTTSTVTTTSSSEVLIGIVGLSLGVAMNSGVTGSNPTSGWTNRFTVDTGKLLLDDVQVAATGNYQEAWNLVAGGQDSAAMCILTLKAPTGGAFTWLMMDEESAAIAKGHWRRDMIRHD